MTKQQAQMSGANIPRLALTVPQAAAALQVGPASIYRLVERGLLRPSRALRTLRFSEAEIQRFLAETV